MGTPVPGSSIWECCVQRVSAHHAAVASAHVLVAYCCQKMDVICVVRGGSCGGGRGVGPFLGRGTSAGAACQKRPPALLLLLLSFLPPRLGRRY
eukprot:5490298-Prymnesium_polylepis.1